MTKLVEVTFDEILNGKDNDMVVCKHPLVEEKRLSVPYEFSMLMCDLGGVFDGKKLRTILKECKWYIEKEDKKSNVVQFPSNKNKPFDKPKISPSLFVEDLNKIIFDVMDNMSDGYIPMPPHININPYNNKPIALLYDNIEYGGTFEDINNTCVIRLDDINNAEFKNIVEYINSDIEGNDIVLDKNMNPFGILYRIKDTGEIYILQYEDTIDIHNTSVTITLENDKLVIE